MVVCSYCSQSGHRCASCPKMIEERALCIFQNGYDPKFAIGNIGHTNSVRNYWFTKSRITMEDSVEGYTRHRHSYVVCGQDVQLVKMCYPVGEFGNLFPKHINEIANEIPNGLEILGTHSTRIRAHMIHFNRISITKVLPSDIDWKPIPNAWFSANHGCGLASYLHGMDSITNLKKIMIELKRLHGVMYDVLPPPQEIDFYEDRYSDSRVIIDSDLETLEDGEIEELDIEELRNVNMNNIRAPGEMPDLRRLDLEIPVVADTQPTDVVVSDATTCGICWDQLGNANCMTTKCGHKFCCDCILSHFQNAGGTNCPLCRNEFAERIKGWLPPEDEEERELRTTRRRGRPRRNRYQAIEPQLRPRPRVVPALPLPIPDDEVTTPESGYVTPPPRQPERASNRIQTSQMYDEMNNDITQALRSMPRSENANAVLSVVGQLVGVLTENVNNLR